MAIVIGRFFFINTLVTGLFVWCHMLFVKRCSSMLWHAMLITYNFVGETVWHSYREHNLKCPWCELVNCSVVLGLLGPYFKILITSSTGKLDELILSWTAVYVLYLRERQSASHMSNYTPHKSAHKHAHTLTNYKWHNPACTARDFSFKVWKPNMGSHTHFSDCTLLL